MGQPDRGERPVGVGSQLSGSPTPVRLRCGPCANPLGNGPGVRRFPPPPPPPPPPRWHCVAAGVRGLALADVQRGRAGAGDARHRPPVRGLQSASRLMPPPVRWSTSRSAGAGLRHLRTRGRSGDRLAGTAVVDAGVLVWLQQWDLRAGGGGRPAPDCSPRTGFVAGLQRAGAPELALIGGGALLMMVIAARGWRRRLLVVAAGGLSRGGLPDPDGLLRTAGAWSRIVLAKDATGDK